MINSLTREQQLELIKDAIHSPLDYLQYDSTLTIKNTNCFSHAIGCTLPNCMNLYRIGAICGSKPIDQNYFSIEEILSLLHEDIAVLELKIEKSFIGDVLKDNQYQIALFVAIYADGKIHDYHFFRNDNHGWSEKFRGSKPYYYNSFKVLSYFPWHLVGIFKITQ